MKKILPWLPVTLVLLFLVFLFGMVAPAQPAQSLRPAERNQHYQTVPVVQLLRRPDKGRNVRV